jgi:hypothetical protein
MLLLPAAAAISDRLNGTTRAGRTTRSGAIDEKAVLSMRAWYMGVFAAPYCSILLHHACLMMLWEILLVSPILRSFVIGLPIWRGTLGLSAGAALPQWPPCTENHLGWALQAIGSLQQRCETLRANKDVARRRQSMLCCAALILRR